MNYKILRQTAVSTDELKVGDKIKMEIEGVSYLATAIQPRIDGMLFLFDDCIAKMPMKESGYTKKGYAESDVYAYLRKCEGKISPAIKSLMQPLENGDLFWLLSLREVCGCDIHFDDVEGQIEWMKDIKHRISYFNGETMHWWLPDVVSSSVVYSTSFAFVCFNGDAARECADYSRGVRPVFMIKNTTQTLQKHNESTSLLTKDEARNVAELIEMNLIDSIRNAIDIDNINWLRNMINAYDKLKEYSGFVSIYDNTTNREGTSE